MYDQINVDNNDFEVLHSEKTYILSNSSCFDWGF